MLSLSKAITPGDVIKEVQIIFKIIGEGSIATSLGVKAIKDVLSLVEGQRQKKSSHTEVTLHANEYKTQVKAIVEPHRDSAVIHVVSNPKNKKGKGKKE